VLWEVVPKKNTVARLKSKYLVSPKFFGWLRYWVQCDWWNGSSAMDRFGATHFWLFANVCSGRDPYFGKQWFMTKQNPNCWYAQEYHSNGDQDRSSWNVGQDHHDLRCANRRSDSAPGVWIEHIINYWAVLAKWWCTRNKLTPHKTYMSVRQVCERKLQSIHFNTKCYFVKNGYIFLDHPVFNESFRCWRLPSTVCLSLPAGSTFAFPG